MKEDEKNIKSIVTCLNKVMTLDAILIIANGTNRRVDVESTYVMHEIQAIFPVSVLDHIFLLLTNCNDLSTSFEVRSLAPVVPKKVFYLQNPFALWKMIQTDKLKGIQANNWDAAKEKERLKKVASIHGESVETLDDLFGSVVSTKSIPTKDFYELYETKCAIELTILVVIKSISFFETKKSELSKIEKNLQEAQSAREAYSSYRKTVVRYDGMGKQTYNVVEEDQHIKAKYMDAKNQVEANERLKADILKQFKSYEAELLKERAKLQAAMDHYQKLSMGGSFIEHLNVMTDLIKLKMRVEQDKEREILQKDLELVESKIKSVKF